MNTQIRKETLSNAQDNVEKRIETTDYRSSAGQGQELRSVEVIHQTNPNKENIHTSGGVLSDAAASVAATLQSAKEAITKN
ncbi:uncharacterized protein LOC126656354 [Mercurialis annua]|uniref:uncharacterized protein LOC126656354 n=1 Tax=Mercurialis annua TaxID=3986 RepID=UPI00215F0B8A|nr:uncharacterized protein LOC126656354 [Mercurialis annua]